MNTFSKSIVLVMVLFMGISTQAQGFLGKVTPEELQEQQDVVYPEADASILAEHGTVYFDYVANIGFKMIKKVSRKIKVYTKEGLDSADLQVSYFNGNGVRESVRINEVNTYNLEAGKVVRSKIKSSAIFDDVKNDGWAIKKAIAPDVKEGSIVEYVYTVESDYLSVIPQWEFQKDIPIRHSKYEVTIPEYLVYTTRLKGTLAVSTNTQYTNKKYRLSNQNPLDEIQLQESVRVYEVKNVKPLKSEPFVDNIDNYRSSIQFDLSIMNLPNREPKKISLSEVDLVKGIWSNKYFVSELNQTKYFEKSIPKEDYADLSDLEKAVKVLEFVKHRMVWNSKNGYLTDLGVRKAFETKIGNAADINFMLTSMLKYVGLEAYPVLVSTIGNGVDLSLQKTTFNKVISSIVIDGQYFFLDATNKYSDVNIIPYANLNWEGIIVKGQDKYDRVSMVPQFRSVFSERFMLSLNPDHIGVGQAMVEFKDYKAYGFRNSFQDKDDSYITRELEKAYGGIEIKDSRILDREQVQKSVNLRFAFDKKDLVQEIAGEMYFNPMQFYGLKTHPFSAQERTMPIWFRLPETDMYNVSFTIPSGYQVDYLPEDLNMSDTDLGFVVNYKIENSNGRILFSFHFTKGFAHIGVEHYAKVKTFYDKLLEKVNDQVVLKKVEGL